MAYCRLETRLTQKPRRPSPARRISSPRSLLARPGWRSTVLNLMRRSRMARWWTSLKATAAASLSHPATNPKATNLEATRKRLLKVLVFRSNRITVIAAGILFQKCWLCSQIVVGCMSVMCK